MTNPDSTVEEHWRELSATMTRMFDSADTVRHWGRHLVTVLGGGGRLLACGNGGSAAEAQHLTAELVGRFKDDRAPFSAIPLHADTSTVTAIVNDYGDQEVFARQVQAHGRPGDVLVVLSTSGRSQNAVAAAKIGQECGLTVWSLTGPTPNPLASASHEYIAVETTSVPTVQEAHLAIIHALCAVFDETLKQGS
ncbi:D-sedoheptulose 7-phosphate isomerase [Stackebrandtia albiflava]|uniref:D-sedoheptulose 7-phosphate isomerase n=1 Tax=Stackebrandtia albiflava TaxID=406432 RepID=A0A562VA56_9ACTN|nr:SIS domain-containing protein [Stackebrandtia albiflava]TWJ14721.1 D-sedoheptulose 7-phosphate isomerase [Stackebrandtia albiflava]